MRKERDKTINEKIPKVRVTTLKEKEMSIHLLKRLL